MKNFLCVGDSHLVALIDAARQVPGAQVLEASLPGPDSPFRTLNVKLPDQQAHLVFIVPGAGAPALPLVQDGQVVAAPAYQVRFRAAIESFEGPDFQVCSYFFGNEHSTFAMIEHPVPFDVFDGPDDSAVSGGAARQVIPLAIIKRHLLELCGRTDIYCRLLRQHFAGRKVTHFLPPPPIPDESQMRSHPEIFGALIAQYGLAPKELRLKIHRLFCQVLSHRLQEIGVGAIAYPQAAASDGYLAEPYWKEATHGNHLYGRLVLAELGIA